MTTINKQRWVPTDYILESSEPSLNLEVYVWRKDGKIYAIGYKGKATKPAFHYSFGSDDRLKTYIDKFISDAKETETRRIQRKEENKPTNKNIKVGDVFKASWGYDQTNVDYYQVIELVGKASAKFKEISCERVNDGDMSGRCVPAINQFCGDEFTAQIRNNAIKVGHQYASLKEYTMIAGVKVYSSDYWSSYA